MGIEKKVGALLLGAALSLSDCASSKVYLFTSPIYPTGLTIEQRDGMREKEAQRQRYEFEEHRQTYPFQDEGHSRVTPIFTLRF